MAKKRKSATKRKAKGAAKKKGAKKRRTAPKKEIGFLHSGSESNSDHAKPFKALTDALDLVGWGAAKVHFAKLFAKDFLHVGNAGFHLALEFFGIGFLIVVVISANLSRDRKTGRHR